MPELKGAKNAAGTRRPYFFLSYAHSDPLAGSPKAKPDELVEKFFRDLTKAVRRHASRRPELVRGFFDQEIPVGSDWKESLSQALGTAQVFVPLYSVRYLDKSYPGREWACFHRRMELTGMRNPGRRFVPVLWTPLSSETKDLPGLKEALSLGASEPGYIENGLRALMKIKLYRPSYRAVVNVLAKQIVALAEKSPIKPSEVPDINEMKSVFTPQSRLSVFTIETAAPTSATVVKGRSPLTYGASSTQWRPFPRQELPLAEYARQVAERFDFEAQVSEIERHRDPQSRRPGIILIDPWFIAAKKGQRALEAAIEELPRWVLPLLILDEPDSLRERKLASQVRDMLGTAGVLRSSRQATREVSSLDDFVSVMPGLVAQAERQYLRQGREQVRSPQSAKRPSLRAAVMPDESDSTPYPSEERRDV
jgi:FxsC-like protein